MRTPRPNSRWTAHRGEHRERYEKYMTSPAWFTRRSWWLAEHHTRTGTFASCLVCGNPDIDLHHLDYAFGHEKYDDLLPLCRTHHTRLHNAWDAIPQLRRLGRRASSILPVIHMRRLSTDPSNLS